MQYKKPEYKKVSSFGEMKNLVASKVPLSLQELVSDKVQKSETLEVYVICDEHANCDSLPLRYGMHFETDSTIILSRIAISDKLQTKSDRIGIDANFTDSNQKDQFGHFVIGSRHGYDMPVLITVWRNDADTERHLSDVMMSLRKEGMLSPAALVELHPDYMLGKIAKHSDLVMLLGKKMSGEQIKQMNEIVSESVARTKSALDQRDQAWAERDTEKAAREKKEIDLAKEKEEHAKTKEREEFYKAESERYKREDQSARRDNKQATLSSPDTLVDVLERQVYRGSSCTILIMGDGSQRHMKTSTFDPSGSVTAHAKTLKGKRVRISCWDPINQPGRWSNEGYFRNVYAVE
jgi:hypothetical protein